MLHYHLFCFSNNFHSKKVIYEHANFKAVKRADAPSYIINKNKIINEKQFKPSTTIKFSDLNFLKILSYHPLDICTNRITFDVNEITNLLVIVLQEVEVFMLQSSLLLRL